MIEERVPAALAIPIPKRDMRLAVRRGLSLRCPACGKGHLFRSYLKPVTHCAACGEDLSEIRADDGPAWLTVLIVGHISVAAAMIFDAWLGWPLWLSMLFYPTLALILCLALLPPAKGVFIGAIWAGERPGPLA